MGAQGLPVRIDARVLENRSEGGGSRRLSLRVPGWPGSGPGQFAMLSAGALTEVERSDPLLPRPMAVYRSWGQADGADLEFLYKVVGRGTALIAEAVAGQRIRIVGPLGQSFPLEEASVSTRAILVGGGTGIASLYELAGSLLGAGRKLDVVLGARSARELMGRDDFESLGAPLHLATEDGSEGERGLVTGPLVTLLAEGGAAIVYSCGPTPMMQRCSELAEAHGARCFVSLENHMACGFGVCLGCAAPRAAGGYALVCRDGPVFDATEIAWETLP